MVFVITADNFSTDGEIYLVDNNSQPISSAGVAIHPSTFALLVCHLWCILLQPSQSLVFPVSAFDRKDQNQENGITFMNQNPCNDANRSVFLNDPIPDL